MSQLGLDTSPGDVSGVCCDLTELVQLTSHLILSLPTEGIMEENVFQISEEYRFMGRNYLFLISKITGYRIWSSGKLLTDSRDACEKGELTFYSLALCLLEPTNYSMSHCSHKRKEHGWERFCMTLTTFVLWGKMLLETSCRVGQEVHRTWKSTKEVDQSRLGEWCLLRL